MSNRVLVVDDDKDIVRVLRAYLEQSGYEVYIAYDGLTAVSIIKHDHPDVVLLDWMLPDRDGLNITQWIRSDPHYARTHIIMLTARVDDTDKVVGLEVGADDYVTKPFNPREVVARVRSTFRRIELNDDMNLEPIYEYQGLVVDMARRHVMLNESTIELTPTEFNLLATLMKRPGYPFTRTELVAKRLGYDYETIERTLDSHIRNLRKKIEPDTSNPTYIQTVYGVGYRLGEP